MGRWLSRMIARQAVPDSLLLAGIVAVPCLVIGALATGAPITTTIHFLEMLIAVMALAIFAGNSGILSFGHVAFMAIAAQVSATLTMAPAMKKAALPLLPDFLLQLQLGFWPALVIAVLVVMAVALLAGMPICRLNGSSASIATLGFLIIVNSLIIGAQGFTRGSQAMYGIPRFVDVPMAACLAAACIIFARLFRDSISGVLLRASRENEAAAQSIGINVPAQRLIAWVASAAVAGIAGVVVAHHMTVFSAKEFYFDLTFALMVMQVVGGMASVAGGVAGTVLITAIIEILRRLENGFHLGIIDAPQIFGLTEIGLSLIVIATLYKRRAGLLGYAELGDLWRRRRWKTAEGPAERVDINLAASQPQSGVEEGVLELDSVSKSYGGLLAVDQVSLALRTGEILGLIGPNGSGKTTLLGCISGTHLATGGRIRIDGTDVTGLPAYRIARLGLGRTFQNIRLFGHLTVLENVLAALAQRDRSASRASLEQQAQSLLGELRIADLAQRPAATLAYGQQRRVEIARALALAPRFMLLDEPAAGMNETETEDLLAILASLVRQRGLGLLIVDHDMPLIMRLCQRVAVLNKGQLIALGVPRDVQQDQAVREAYLGRRHAQKMIA